MPPHCDSLDGPVVTAARQALTAGDVDLVLPYVPADGEHELRSSFARVLPVHRAGGVAADIARQWFYETVVRVHRAGEHAPYTGLKPAGLDVGPIIPMAEKAVESGDVDDVYRLLAADLHTELTRRLDQVTRLAAGKDGSVPAARAYVQAVLGFQVYAHHLYQRDTPSPVIARAAHSTAARTRSSSSRPKPIMARSRLPLKQWMTADGGGCASRAEP
jgi:hypothetical protein